MHDVYVLYGVIPDRVAFLEHYTGVHTPLVDALPELQEFSWGFVDDPEPGAPLLIARLTYPSRESADRSFASEAGRRSVADVANFAPEGVQLLHVTRGR